MMKENNLKIPQNKLITFTDASWQDCPDTGRSTVGRISVLAGGTVDHSSTVPVPVAMSSAEAEYLGASVACMSAAHLRMLVYDFEHLGSNIYHANDVEKTPPALILLDNTAAKAMAQNDRDTQHTRHILRRYHYVRQGCADKAHELAWISTSRQLADILTKNGKFTELWNYVFVTTEQ